MATVADLRHQVAELTTVNTRLEALVHSVQSRLDQTQIILQQQDATNKKLAAQVDENTALRRALITRIKQLEEDFEGLAHKQVMHSLQIIDNQNKLSRHVDVVSKLRRKTKTLATRVFRKIVADDVLTNLISDSDSGCRKRATNRTETTDPRLGKRRQPN